MAELLYPSHPVLIIDDEMPSLLTLEAVLNELGISHIILCDDSREAEKLLAEQTVSVILLDLKMPYISGENLIPVIKQKAPDAPIIIVTASTDVQSAVRCMKQGVYDYLLKNDTDERLRPVIRKALEIYELKQLNRHMEEKLRSPRIEHEDLFSSIITRSIKMLEVFEYIEAICHSPATVLITGETGTGKELVAKSIHTASGRKGEFVAINVAALDEAQFADTLFGHTPGAFTDAKGSRKGLVELAQGGTLFFDEVADISLETQQKLLRLLEEREFRPLGVDRSRISTARIVAATNKNLLQLVKSGAFRHDLFYRLHTHTIRLPPLRERQGDIPLLITHFITEAAKENDLKAPMVSADALELLTNYPYPGNIRELRALLYDCVLACKGKEITAAYLNKKYIPEQGADRSQASKENLAQEVIFPEVLPSLRQLKQLLFKEAIRRVNGNKTMAAKLLGISRQAIMKRSQVSRTRETPHSREKSQ